MRRDVTQFEHGWSQKEERWFLSAEGGLSSTTRCSWRVGRARTLLPRLRPTSPRKGARKVRARLAPQLIAGVVRTAR